MSECGVCVGTGYDGGAGETLCEEIRKARKPHFCCECGDAIKVGDRYEYIFGKWEGDLLAYRTCLACMEIRNAFCCDGWIYTQLWEDFQYSFDALTTGCFENLETVAAKKKLMEKWNEWKFDRGGN